MKEIFDIKATEKETGFEIIVRKMREDEMPKNGITYYCQESGQIYRESEIKLDKQKDKE